MAIEKYILTQKELHLGFMKETFGRGALIEFDSDTRQIMVDGRKFDEFRDLEILKRQAIRNPEKPWIVEFTEKLFAHYTGTETAPSLPQPKQQPGNDMKVIQSDSDIIDAIDISGTKVTDADRRAAESKANADGDKMPIIRGDETVEDRIAAFEKEEADLVSRGKSTMDVIGRKTKLMASEPAKMKIVHDDSLGSVGGSSASALNAGMPVMSREDVESKTDAKAIADSRKLEAEGNRQNLLANEGLDGEKDVEVAPAVATSSGVDSAPADVAPLDAPSENERLKTENGDLQKQMSEMKAKMDEMSQKDATSSDESDVSAESAESVDRIPVIDEEPE